VAGLSNTPSAKENNFSKNMKLTMAIVGEYIVAQLVQEIFYFNGT
jgi:hypothetical protein